MSALVEEIFEQELRKRELRFVRDSKAPLYTVRHKGALHEISLDNVARQFAQSNDTACVSRFVEAALAIENRPASWAEAQSSVLFSLEPTDYSTPPPIHMAMSRQVDRVPVFYDQMQETITWISPAMLEDWRISEADLKTRASENLAALLADTKIEYREIDGVRIAMFDTYLPFKTALTLAPNFREIISPVLQWPLYAVMPDRDFVYLWHTRHQDFIPRIGKLVVREYRNAPYPLTTEVFEVSDKGMNAIGAFSVDS